jgi:hypothetical protein
MRHALPQAILARTFDLFRTCGRGRCECQALWVGPWSHPHLITEVVHPVHSASAVGFDVDSDWLSEFWTRLAKEELGIRVQCHTHPGAAYHSATDDAVPILKTPGFLSFVVPRFATGAVGFEGAFLARVDDYGVFREVPLTDHLELV